MSDFPMEDVCILPNGCILYRQLNEAGGYTYYSDEVGGGVFVWNTALVDSNTLLTAIIEDNRRLIKERHKRKKVIPNT